MEIEGFNLGAIDIDSHRLLDEIQADDQAVPLFARHEYALSASQQAALDPYTHAFDEIRVWTTGEAMLHHGAHGGNLLIGYWHRFTIDTHNARHADGFQHCYSVLQSKIAKEITAEQRDINDLDAIFPDTALPPQRQQLGNALRR
jgi:hypothetical protein